MKEKILLFCSQFDKERNAVSWSPLLDVFRMFAVVIFFSIALFFLVSLQDYLVRGIISLLLA